MTSSMRHAGLPQPPPLSTSNFASTSGSGVCASTSRDVTSHWRAMNLWMELTQEIGPELKHVFREVSSGNRTLTDSSQLDEGPTRFSNIG